MTKRTLSLFLAFVMICSTCLFSASAETINAQQINAEQQIQQIQQAVADAIATSGGELYMPTATGDTATYALAAIPNGAVLVCPIFPGPGYSPYFDCFSTTDMPSTWVFSEYIPGSYRISPISQQNLYLTVNPSSGSVSLQGLSDDPGQFWSPITYGDGIRLLTNSSASGIAGKYLDASSVSASGTVYGMIPSGDLVGLSALYQYGAVIQKNTTKTLSAPTYSNAATYDFSPWVSYTSSNPSVCTVSSDGVVSAWNTGAATVLVTNSIMQYTYTCPITIVDGGEAMDVSIVYELSQYTSSFSSSSEYVSVVENALSLFEAEFYISGSAFFERSTSNLNGNAFSSIHPTIDSICTVTSCGAEESCRTEHHRGAARLLEVDVGIIINPYLIRFVHHKMCFYDSRHKVVNGLTTIYGNDAIVNKTSDALLVTRHEISHWFGVPDNACNNSFPCIMNQRSDSDWCVNCYNQIVQGRASTP